MSDKEKVPIDMMGDISIALIDDDESIQNLLEIKFPFVFFQTFTIDEIMRFTGDWTKSYSLIFIDTFYKDNKTNGYAIDFFELHQKAQNSHQENGAKNNYYVLVSIDEINWIINGQTSQYLNAMEAKTEIMALMGKVRNHPYVEWGKKKGSKIDKIEEIVEKYAQENNIYLYRKKELSYDEWIKLREFYIYRVQTLINELQKQYEKVGLGDVLNSVIEDFKAIIEEAKNKEFLNVYDSNKNTILSIIDHINGLNIALSQKLDVLGQKEQKLEPELFFNNRNIRVYFHHFRNFFESTGLIIFGQQRILQRKEGDRAD